MIQRLSDTRIWMGVAAVAVAVGMALMARDSSVEATAAWETRLTQAHRLFDGTWVLRVEVQPPAGVSGLEMKNVRVTPQDGETGAPDVVSSLDRVAPDRFETVLRTQAMPEASRFSVAFLLEGIRGGTTFSERRILHHPVE